MNSKRNNRRALSPIFCAMAVSLYVAGAAAQSGGPKDQPSQKELQKLLGLKGSESGLLMTVSPKFASRKISMQDGDGNVLDAFRPNARMGYLLKYRLEPGEYQITLPGRAAPITVTFRAGEVQHFGIGKEATSRPLELGQVILTPPKQVSPAKNQLKFSFTNGGPAVTDDPGPSHHK